MMKGGTRASGLIPLYVLQARYEWIIMLLIMDEKKLRDLVQRTILVKLAESGEHFVPVASSNRHIHLCQKDVDALFSPGYRLKRLRDLSQTGQYACEEVVTLVTPKGKLGLRVLGPTRNETQIELSIADAISLGIKPVVRMSGNIAGTPGGRITVGGNSVDLSHGIIVAARHMHISTAEAAVYGVKDGDFVTLTYDGLRPTAFKGVAVRVHKDFLLEAHLDRDEANAAFIKDGALCRLELEGVKSEASTEITVNPSAIFHYKEVEPLKKLVTEQDVRDVQKSGAAKLVHAKNAIITPLARDTAREYRIELMVGGTV